MSKFDEVDERERDATASILEVTAEDLMAMEEELAEVVAAIGQSLDMSSAESAVSELDCMQSLLAKLAFKHKVSLTPKLYHVVRQLDRLDDSAIRLAVYEASKAGQFWNLQFIPD